MKGDDWARLLKLAGYVYIPIVLFVVGLFVFIEYRSNQIEKLKREYQQQLTRISIRN